MQNAPKISLLPQQQPPQALQHWQGLMVAKESAPEAERNVKA